MRPRQRRSRSPAAMSLGRKTINDCALWLAPPSVREDSDGRSDAVVCATGPPPHTREKLGEASRRAATAAGLNREECDLQSFARLRKRLPTVVGHKLVSARHGE